MTLLCRQLPPNLILVSLYRRGEVFQTLREKGVTRTQRNEQNMARLELQYRKLRESEKRAEMMGNKASDIKEFDTEKSFIQKFISEHRSGQSSRKKKKNNYGKQFKPYTGPIPVVAC